MPKTLLLVALLATACAAPRVSVHATTEPRELARDVYVVTAITPTERGERFVAATARCEDGDQVLAGGCTWGASEDPADLPLYPMTDAPDGLDGWTCRGLNGGVGTHLEPVVATAICEVSL
jgi:hypothetical protein